MKNAAALFQDFTGHNATHTQRVEIDWPDVGAEIGQVDGILYTTIRDGAKEHYIHEFKKTARPSLVASHDGASIALIGGEYDFTDAGIVDH